MDPDANVTSDNSNFNVEGLIEIYEIATYVNDLRNPIFFPSTGSRRSALFDGDAWGERLSLRMDSTVG